MEGTITWDSGGLVVVNITSFTPVTLPGGNPGNHFEDEYADAAFPALIGAEDFVGTWAGDRSNYLITFANTGTWTSKMVIGVTTTTLLVSRKFQLKKKMNW
jgi:hypothetical protein